MGVLYKGEKVFLWKLTGISVLRFLAVVCPNDSSWIDKLLEPFGEFFFSFGKGQAAVRRDVPMSYLLMAFADINNEKNREWILRKNGGQEYGI